ncbi:hypothetical protein Dcar01_03711 [Deinococcus carri]|uniref:Uncharacterized protein n=1 Tax=Deinococcus carri TaxID=1211323 RepID=A0ABP9WC97_9DEIO
MLASELAAELQVDPSVISKHLNVYFGELGQERQRYLSDQTADQVRQAHQLLETGGAKSFRTAVQMVLGMYSEPVPPESARLIEQRLARLEDIQQQTLGQVNQMLRYLETAMEQLPEESAEHVQQE